MIIYVHNLHSSLLAACSRGHTDIYIYEDFLGYMIIYTHDLHSPLLAACSRGHTEVVQLLLAATANINSTNKVLFFFLLHSTNKVPFVIFLS